MDLDTLYRVPVIEHLVVPIQNPRDTAADTQHLSLALVRYEDMVCELAHNRSKHLVLNRKGLSLLERARVLNP